MMVPAANWMIENIGSQSFPGGPHTIPVGFGYTAPSGVILIGIALALRDYVQERLGKNVTLAAISIGIVVSYFVNPSVAIASALAFGVSELIDFAVYTRIRRRNRYVAIGASGIIGGIVDSVIFLQVAFGSTMFWQGQVIGKTFVAIIAAFISWGYRDISKRMYAK